MKRIASILAVATSVFAVALPSFAQVQVIPITGGKLSVTATQTGGTVTSGYSIVVNSASNFLTPAGILSLSSAPNTTYVYNYSGFLRNSGGLPPASGVLTNTSASNLEDIYVNSIQLTGKVDGNLAGTPFTAKSIVINATTSVIDVTEANFFIHNHGFSSFTHVFDSSINTQTVTGTLTLPAPPAPVTPPPTPITCTSCLIVRPDLLISYSTLQYSPLDKPEYSQEYRNDFSTSSFEGGRILGLKDE